MLSRWLNPGNANPVSRQSTSLDSSIDDAHTRDLLFPPPSLLNHSQTHAYPLRTSITPSGHGPAGGFDTQRGTYLDGPNDVRIIIAHDDAAGAGSGSLLYDSAPPAGPLSPCSRKRLSPRPKTSEDLQMRRTAKVTGLSHANRDWKRDHSGTHSSSDTPSSTFGRNRTRGSSISSLPDLDEKGYDSQLDEFTRSCLECIFGKHKLAYKGNTIKLHVLSQPSTQARAAKVASSAALGTLGKMGGPQRSQLSNSCTPSDAEFQSFGANEGQGGPPKSSQRSQIMITRTFDIPLTNDKYYDPAASTTPVSNGNPTPSVGADHKEEGQDSGHQRARFTSSTFAVAVIVQLPAAYRNSASQSMSTHSGFHLSSSSQASDSLSSSLESDKRGGWTFLDPFPHCEQLTSTSDDDPLCFVTQHLDVFQRTLMSLQLLVQAKLIALLKLAESTSASCVQSASASKPRITLGTIPAVVNSTIRLRSHEFAGDDDVRESVAHAIRRIKCGTTTLQVVTGQCKWSVWREELRWVERWAVGRARGQSLFLLKLLTAYLGLHTEWLNDVAPEWYRRRRSEQERSGSSEDMTLTRRTVIVSKDKMAARRLIFLLSAFLPCPFAQFHGMSEGLSNHSGPRIHEQLLTQGDQSLAVSASSSHVPQERYGPSSDAQTIPNLTIPITSGTRRSSSATISTATALPIAHLANPILHQNPEPPSSPWPGSSANSVSSSLLHRLHRQNTANGSNSSSVSPAGSRWSLLNFWTAQGSQSSRAKAERVFCRNKGTKTGSCSKGAVATNHSDTCFEPTAAELRSKGADGELYAHDLEDDTDNDQRARQDMKSPTASPSRERRRQREFASSVLKLSVGSNGIIDIDMPSPLRWSPIHSPRDRDDLSASDAGGKDLRGTYLCPGHHNTNTPIRAAGWLERLQEDFELQAVNRYAGLEEDVKRAMRAEPTPPVPASFSPSVEHGPIEEWVEVCSTLIADTATGSIKRLRLRRKVRLLPLSSASSTMPGPSLIPRTRFHKGHPCPKPSVARTVLMVEEYLEDKFVEEQLSDVDELLSDAVHRVLAQSKEAGSTARPSSKSKRSDQGQKGDRSENAFTVEVSRSECRKVVVGALEDTIRIVQEARLKEWKDGDRPTSERTQKGRTRQAPSSSCLREGVRKWLEEVEKPLQAFRSIT